MIWAALGLTKWEKAIYLTLIKFGPLTAAAISKKSNVPYGRIYGVLETFELKGFVAVELGKPKRFRAIDPAIALKTVFKEKQKEISELEQQVEREITELTRVYAPSIIGEEQRIYVIKGIENINKVRIALLSSAKKEVNIVVGLGATTRAEIPMIDAEMRRALDRGVKMSFIRNLADLEERKKARSELAHGARVRHFPFSGFHLSIRDRKEVWIELPDPKEGMIDLFIVNPALAKAFCYFFNLLWKRAQPARKYLKKKAKEH